jgi:hypothetical protein
VARDGSGLIGTRQLSQTYTRQGLSFEAARLEHIAHN